MSGSHPKPTPEALAALAAGTLAEEEARTVAQAARTDLRARAELVGHQRLLDELAEPVGPDLDLVANVRALRQRSERPARHWGIWGAAAACAAALLVLPVWSGLGASADAAVAVDEAFQARGDLSDGRAFRSFRVGRDALQPIPREGALVHQSDAFAFTYSMGGQADGHLAVFILAGDEVFWCVPFWSTDGPVPALLKLPKGTSQLKPTHQISHRLPLGSATLVAWFAPRSFTTEEVEQLLDGRPAMEASAGLSKREAQLQQLRGGSRIEIPLEVVP